MMVVDGVGEEGCTTMKFSNVKFYSKYYFDYTFCTIFDNFHNKGEKVDFEWFCNTFLKFWGERKAPK